MPPLLKTKHDPEFALVHVNAAGAARKTPVSSSSPFGAARTPTSFASSASVSGTAATASASIVTPHVRVRGGWEAVAASVGPYHLPSTFLHHEDPSSLPLRYIADEHDLIFLSSAALSRYRRGEESDAPGAADMSAGGGKRGVQDPAPQPVTPQTQQRHPSAPEHVVEQFEIIMTELELSASSCAPGQLEEASSAYGTGRGDSFAACVKQYWLQRRAAMGTTVPLIPRLRALHSAPDNAGPVESILGDCPMPFRARDWNVPVMHRREPATGVAARRRRSTKREGLGAFKTLVRAAEHLSRALVEREMRRLAHSQMVIYELACTTQVCDEATGYTKSGGVAVDDA